MASDFVDSKSTRTLQASPSVRQHNWNTILRWGAYNLMKVMAHETPTLEERNVSGYICLLASISGQTPDEMARNLGLREGQLARGADIYQLTRLPHFNAFEVRGYTTLVDGKRLAPGLKQDSAGYRPGWGSLQIELPKTARVPGRLFATVLPGQRFKPPTHPKYQP